MIQKTARYGMLGRLDAFVDRGLLRRISGPELAVLLVMERYGNAGGETNVSQVRIAEILGVSERSVRRHMKILASLNAIVQLRHSAPGQIAVWKITPDAMATPAKDDRCADGNLAPSPANYDQCSNTNSSHLKAEHRPILTPSPAKNDHNTGHPRGRHIEVEQENKFPLQGKGRPTDLIWDTVAALWFGGSVATPHRSRVGKLVKDFRALGATPEEIEARRERHKATWPTCEATPESLVKHWNRFAGSASEVDAETESLFQRKCAGECINLSAEQQPKFDAWRAKRNGHRLVEQAR